jgi:hypothetical protein
MTLKKGTKKAGLKAREAIVRKGRNPNNLSSPLREKTI